MKLDCQKCRDYVDIFSIEIAKKLKARNSGLLSLSLEEIKYEVLVSCLMIEANFKRKAGGRSFASYFFKYGERYAFREILKNSKSICCQAVAHQYGEYAFEPRKNQIDIIDDSDFIKSLYNFGIDDKDRLIVLLFFERESLRSIGSMVGLSHSSVKKRLKQLYCRFKNWEESPLAVKAKGFFMPFYNE